MRSSTFDICQKRGSNLPFQKVYTFVRSSRLALPNLKKITLVIFAKALPSIIAYINLSRHPSSRYSRYWTQIKIGILDPVLITLIAKTKSTHVPNPTHNLKPNKQVLQGPNVKTFKLFRLV